MCTHCYHSHCVLLFFQPSDDLDFWLSKSDSAPPASDEVKEVKADDADSLVAGASPSNEEVYRTCFVFILKGLLAQQLGV